MKNQGHTWIFFQDNLKDGLKKMWDWVLKTMRKTKTELG